MNNSSLLVTILLLLVVEPLLSDDASPRWVFALLVSAVFVAAVGSIGRRRGLLVTGLALAAPALAGQWLHHVVHERWLIFLSLVCVLVFIVFTVGVVLHRVLASATVTTDTIAGAVSVYLLLAVIWATIFALIDLAQPGSFQLAGQPFAESSLAQRPLVPRYLYLSLVTLTTVGYGDVLPVTPIARRVAVLEAVVGQMYLAVLVARLVALHVSSPDRPAPR